MTTTTTMKKGIGLHCWWQDVSQRRRKPSLLGAGGGGNGTCFERWTESSSVRSLRRCYSNTGNGENAEVLRPGGVLGDLSHTFSCYLVLLLPRGG